MVRCGKCGDWYCMKPTGWRTQHQCQSCGELGYLYPWDRRLRDEMTDSAPPPPLPGREEVEPPDPFA